MLINGVVASAVYQGILPGAGTGNVLVDELDDYLITQAGERIEYREDQVTQVNLFSFPTGRTNICNDLLGIGNVLIVVGTGEYGLKLVQGAPPSILSPTSTGEAISNIDLGQSDRIFICSVGSGVYYSDDLGITWTHALNNSSVERLACNDSGVIVACTSSSSTGYVSTDNGETFSSVEQNDALVNDDTFQLVRWHSDLNLFIKLDAGGIINTSPDGQVWTQLDFSGTLGSPSWAGQSVIDGTIYIGSLEGNLYTSADNLATLTEVTSFFNDSYASGSQSLGIRSIYTHAAKMFIGHSNYKIQVFTEEEFKPVPVSATTSTTAAVQNYTTYLGSVWGVAGSTLLRTMEQ